MFQFTYFLEFVNHSFLVTKNDESCFVLSNCLSFVCNLCLIVLSLDMSKILSMFFVIYSSEINGRRAS